MGKYESLSNEIIRLIGGKDNIKGLTHCVTRLRFHLKDDSKPKDQELKDLDGVVTVMRSGGQFQVVIGNHVADVYAEICKIAGIHEDHSKDEGETGGATGIFDIISGCFQPFLGAMCASGMIKGMNALFIFWGLYTLDSGTYLMINAIGDAIFYYLPIFVGYTSAKKFNLNPMLGLSIGAILCYPSIQLSAFSALEPAGVLFEGSFMELTYNTTFIGIPFLASNYVSSVIPVIIIVAFAGQVQKLAKKFIPKMVQTFFVPFTVLLVSLSVGFLLIGPVITMLTSLLGDFFLALNGFSPVLLSTIVGFVWQIMVIFGLHWSLIPLALLNQDIHGYDTLMVGMYETTFAQVAVVCAMFLKSKDKSLKNLCFPAIISGICGVTEPAIYGITLPKKTPFIFSLIGGAAGGAVMGLMNTKYYTMGGMGIFGIVNYINPATGEASGMTWAAVCILVSSLTSFLLTLIFWKDNTVEATEKKAAGSVTTGSKEIIISPIKGKVIDLARVKDDAFAQETLGKGAAIEPLEGKVVAPFDGTVMALFPTNHAIALASDFGCELLIHIGLDTVKLDGKYFKAYVKQGDKVKKGDTLITFELDEIKKEGYCMETPVIVTNVNDYLEIARTKEEVVQENTTLLTILF